MNKKFALTLKGFVIAAVILLFFQFFPIVACYSRFLGRQLDISIQRICLIAIALLIFGAFMVPRFGQTIIN